MDGLLPGRGSRRKQIAGSALGHNPVPPTWATRDAQQRLPARHPARRSDAAVRSNGSTARAHAKAQPNPDSMALATATPDGRPSVRVVLCKKLVADPGYVVFFTNYDSRKGARARGQPARRPPCSTGTRSAARCGSKAASCARPADESDAYFASRALDSRIGAWASLQSQPLDSRTTLLKRVASRGRPLRHPRAAPAALGRLPAVARRRVELWIEGPFRVHDRARWTRTLEPAGAAASRRARGRPTATVPVSAWPQRTFFGTLRIAILLAVLRVRRARRLARPRAAAPTGTRRCA
ncbi:MAG: pyridoxamine 5'-phosphate oxidase family protein [Chromatiales bacterium]|nr:pyridoxamine 5'-phosphate oxidase family protein [Chromatiales bacterium]